MSPTSVRMSWVLLLLATLVVACPAFGDPFTPGASPALTPEARQNLSEAAGDTLLPRWQREFMLGLAGGDTQASLSSADGVWSEPYPTARFDHAAIYDPVRDRMVVFGGDDRAERNDVWELPLAGDPEWTKLAPIGTPPTGRSGHTAIYDPVRDRMVVFGGHSTVGGSGLLNNDVWALSLSGSPAWTPLAPLGTPPSRRRDHTAIYDPVRDRMVIFGGDDGFRRNDVLALSLAGTPSWSTLVPSGVPPNERYWHTAIYDPMGERMVVFGGYDGSFRNDVWTLSFAGSPSWSVLLPAGTPPDAIYSHTAIYDPVRNRMVVFGGLSNSPPNATWALSLSGSPAWTMLAPAETPEVGRYSHTTIYDPVRDRMVIFGGIGIGDLNDTWALSLAGSPAWSRLSTEGLTTIFRSGHTAIYDPVRDRMVVFAGIAGGGLSNDTWGLSLAGSPVWTQLATTGGPPSMRIGHTAIYDPVRDRMVVFGGFERTTGPSGALTNDVWTLSLAGPAWHQIVIGPSPSARQYHTAIYDPVRDRMLVFGGDAGSDRNDTWALSLAGVPAWTQLAPTGGPPVERSHHTAVYDPVRDQMIVFGGGQSRKDDVWALSLAGDPVWTQLAPTGGPPSARSAHTAIYDPVRDRMVVFAGEVTDPGADLWALSLSGSPAWTTPAPTGVPPSQRSSHTSIYDPVRDRMVVFGGQDLRSRNDIFFLTWGAPAIAGVTCPADIPWVPGADNQLHYGVTNPNAFAQAVDYWMTCGRYWPGFPVFGSVMVGANSAVTIPVQVSVPDSATGGSTALFFRATLRSQPQTAACVSSLLDTTTAVLVSLVSAQATADRVRLVWYFAESGGRPTIVYRRTPNMAWAPLGVLTADGTGYLRYEDLAVSSGARYGYRLGIMDEGQEVFAGETWVEVPEPGLALALVGQSPSSNGRVLVEFALADGTEARLELADIGGRVVASRQVGHLGAGRHTLDIAEGRGLRSGIYFLRLRQGGKEVRARAAVLR